MTVERQPELLMRASRILFFLLAVICCGFFSINALFILDAIVTPANPTSPVSRAAVVIGLCLAIDLFSGVTFWRVHQHVSKSKQFTSTSEEMASTASSYNQLTIAVIVIAIAAVLVAISFDYRFFPQRFLDVALFLIPESVQADQFDPRVTALLPSASLLKAFLFFVALPIITEIFIERNFSNYQLLGTFQIKRGVTIQRILLIVFIMLLVQIGLSVALIRSWPFDPDTTRIGLSENSIFAFSAVSFVAIAILRVITFDSLLRCGYLASKFEMRT